MNRQRNNANCLPAHKEQSNKSDANTGPSKEYPNHHEVHNHQFDVDEPYALSIQANLSTDMPETISIKSISNQTKGEVKQNASDDHFIKDWYNRKEIEPPESLVQENWGSVLPKLALHQRKHEAENDRVKRHFSSLLKFRENPFYTSDYFFNRQLKPKHNEKTTIDEEDDDVLKKRFLGSTFRSSNIPERFLLYPQKKHLASLVKSQSIPSMNQKRFLGSVLKSDRLGRNLNYANEEFSSFPSNKQSYYTEMDKRHIGSLRGNRNILQPRFYKRFFGSLLKSPNFAIGGSRGFKRNYDQAMMKDPWSPDESYEREKDTYSSFPVDYLNDIDQDFQASSPLYTEMDVDFQNEPLKEYSPVSWDGTSDKQHLSSFMKGKYKYLQKRQISKSDMSNESAIDNITEILPEMDNKYLPKRHISSVFDGVNKREFSTLLQGDETEKRHLSSPIKNKDGGEKRHLSSLLDTTKTDKRYIGFDSSNFENEEVGSQNIYNDNNEKRHYSSLLKNSDEANNLHIPSLVQDSNLNMDKQFHPSLFNKRTDSLSANSDLQNLSGELDKRYFSSLLKSKMKDKKHFSSLLDDANNDEVKRYYISELLKDTNDNKRSVSSLLQHLDQNPETDSSIDSLLRTTYKNSLNNFKSNLDDTYPVVERRFFTTLLRDDATIDKRSLPPSEERQIDDLSLNEEKRHLASLRSGKRLDEDIDENKRHIASLRHGKRSDEDELREIKRHLASLRGGKRSDEHIDENKRHLVSLRQGKRSDEDELREIKRHLTTLRGGKLSDEEIDENKRYLASLRQGKRSDVDELREIKRHLASLRSEKRSDEDIDENKRYLASLRQGRRSDEDELREIKRHLALLRGEKRSDEDIAENKRHLASLQQGKRSAEDELREIKRHLASLRGGKRSDEDIDEDKRHQSSPWEGKRSDVDELSEVKRHLGSLRGDKRLDDFTNLKRHLSSLRAGKRSQENNDENNLKFSPLNARNQPKDDEFNKSKHNLASLSDGKRYADNVEEEKIYRNLGFLRGVKRSDDEMFEIKRNLASLYGRQLSNLDLIETKRHLSSLREGKRMVNENFDEIKSHLSSLQNKDKRNIASLRKLQEGEIYENKRHIASLRGNKRVNKDEIGVDKKHLASLKDSKRSNEKDNEELKESDKQATSLRVFEQTDPNTYIENDQIIRGDEETPDHFDDFKKHHLSSLRNGQQKSDIKPYQNDLKKRYFSSLLKSSEDDDYKGKRHLSARLHNIYDPVSKRYYGTLFDSDSTNFGSDHSSTLNGVNNDKRGLPSVLRALPGNRGLARPFTLSYSPDYGYLGYSDNDFDFNPQTNYSPLQVYPDVLRDEIGVNKDKHAIDDRVPSQESLDEQKRHLGSLYNAKRTGLGALNGFNEMAQVKRNLDALNTGDRLLFDHFNEEKRYLGSLKNGKRNAKEILEENGPQIKSLLDGKQNYFSDVNEDNINVKRHMSSILDKKDFEEDLLAIKRHLASLRNGKRSKRETQKEMRSYSPKSKSSSNIIHSRQKRYIGALAKNGNLPFRPSRGSYYHRNNFWTLPHNSFAIVDMDDSDEQASMLDSPSSGDSLRILPVIMEGSDEEAQNYLSGSTFQGELGSEEEVRRDAEENQRRRNRFNEASESNNWVPVNNGYFRNLSKRFLGSLARRLWFPRPYRSFAEAAPIRPPLLSGHRGSYLPYTSLFPSKSLRY